MAADPSAWQQRGDQIRRRLAAIQLRLDELRAKRSEAPAVPGDDRLASAHRHAIASQDAAEQAAAAGARAFRTSAQAHERAARQHERSAAAGSGDKDEHDRQAAAHRAAASADARRADKAQSLLPKQDDKLAG